MVTSNQKYIYQTWKLVCTGQDKHRREIMTWNDRLPKTCHCGGDLLDETTGKPIDRGSANKPMGIVEELESLGL